MILGCGVLCFQVLGSDYSYLYPKGIYFSSRVYSEVGNNSTVLAPEPQGVCCRGLPVLLGSGPESLTLKPR